MFSYAGSYRPYEKDVSLGSDRYARERTEQEYTVQFLGEWRKGDSPAPLARALLGLGTFFGEVE